MTLNDIKAFIQAEDKNIPYIPKEVVDYLQLIFSPSYQLQVNTPDYLRSTGQSSDFILGYLQGMHAASQIIEQAITTDTDD